MARNYFNTLSSISAQISGVDFGSLISSTLPTSQPAVPGLWNDGGVLTFYNGTTNEVVDYNEGQVTDAFGINIGIDK